MAPSTRTRQRPAASRWHARALGLLLVGPLLAGSTCHAHYCSGEHCNKEEEEGGRTETLRRRPLLLPHPALPAAPWLFLPEEPRARVGPAEDHRLGPRAPVRG